VKHLCDIIKEGLVLTLDNEFKIYRKANRQVIPTVMPAL